MGKWLTVHSNPAHLVGRRDIDSDNDLIPDRRAMCGWSSGVYRECVTLESCGGDSLLAVVNDALAVDQAQPAIEAGVCPACVEIVARRLHAVGKLTADELHGAVQRRIDAGGPAPSETVLRRYRPYDHRDYWTAPPVL